MKIDIGFKYKRKTQNTFKESYTVQYHVIGKFVDYFGGGSKNIDINKLINSDHVLQIVSNDYNYFTHNIFKIKESELVKIFEEDQKLKTEFQKYIL